MARTERETDSRRREMADLLVLSRPPNSVQNGAVQKNAGAALAKGKKEQSRHFRVPDHGGESQCGREPHLGKREGIRARAWRGMGGLHGEERQILGRKGRASKKSLPGRSIGSMSG